MSKYQQRFKGTKKSSQRFAPMSQEESEKFERDAAKSAAYGERMAQSRKTDTRTSGAKVGHALASAGSVSGRFLGWMGNAALTVAVVLGLIGILAFGLSYLFR